MARPLSLAPEMRHYASGMRSPSATTMKHVERAGWIMGGSYASPGIHHIYPYYRIPSMLLSSQPHATLSYLSDRPRNTYCSLQQSSPCTRQSSHPARHASSHTSHYSIRSHLVSGGHCCALCPFNSIPLNESHHAVKHRRISSCCVPGLYVRLPFPLHISCYAPFSTMSMCSFELPLLMGL